MGTISEKLTYLNDTKQLLKENINSLGGNLTNESFRQYASVLEDIYERLPKISGIGASLSLSPSMVGKIKLNEIQGDTLQDGTPTPSSPVPIESVTGEQDVVVCGKNLLKLNKDTSAGGSYDSTTDTYSSTSRTGTDVWYAKIPVKSGKYTFSCNSISNAEYKCRFSNNNITNASDIITFTYNGTTISYGNLTINNADNYKYLYVTFRTATHGINATLEKPMLEVGETATTYEPYKGNTYEVNLGKNLYYMNYNDETTTNFNGVDITSTHTGYSINGTATSNTAFTLVNRYITLPAGTYTVSLKEASSMTIRLSKTNYSVITAISIGQTSSSFTLSEETKVCLTLVLVNGTQYNETNEVMIEKGNATSYSPYFTPIELNKIGDYEDSIKKSTGKNLFDKDNADIIESYFDYSNVGLLKSANGNKTLIIECKPNTTYTVSKIASTRFRIGCNNERITTGQVNSAVYGSSSDTSLTITTGANDKYLYVFYWVTSDTITEQTILDSIMINEGSTALPYEPYGKVWYITKNIGKVVLNGSETYTSGSTTASGVYRIRTTIIESLIKIPSSAGVNGNAMSNYFKITTANQNYQRVQGFGVETSGALVFYDSSGNTQTVSAFTTWLSTHNTIIYYALATPIYEVITNTELIEQLESLYNAKSKDGTTNINVDGSLPVILGVKVLKGE